MVWVLECSGQSRRRGRRHANAATRGLEEIKTKRKTLNINAENLELFALFQRRERMAHGAPWTTASPGAAAVVEGWVRGYLGSLRCAFCWWILLARAGYER